MFGISGFFKKIQDAYAKEVLVRECVRTAIFKHTGADVPVSSIAFKSNIVRLEGVSQSLKSAIYIKKQAILKEIASLEDIRPVVDIA